MSPLKMAEKALKEHGFKLKRHGSGHDIWVKPGRPGTVPLKRHDFNDNDLKYILKEIAILEAKGDQ